MPGCAAPAGRADIDHVIPARPDPCTGRPTLGPTNADNLATECRHHHLAKDGGGGFGLVSEADGSFTWSTPLGRTYRREPKRLWYPPEGNHPSAEPTDSRPDHSPSCRRSTALLISGPRSLLRPRLAARCDGVPMSDGPPTPPICPDAGEPGRRPVRTGRQTRSPDPGGPARAILRSRQARVDARSGQAARRDRLLPVGPPERCSGPDRPGRPAVRVRWSSNGSGDEPVHPQTSHRTSSTEMSSRTPRQDAWRSR